MERSKSKNGAERFDSFVWFRSNSFGYMKGNNVLKTGCQYLKYHQDKVWLEKMDSWCIVLVYVLYVYVCIRDGCMCCVALPAWAFSCIF